MTSFALQFPGRLQPSIATSQKLNKRNVGCQKSARSEKNIASIGGSRGYASTKEEGERAIKGSLSNSIFST